MVDGDVCRPALQPPPSCSDGDMRFPYPLQRRGATAVPELGNGDLPSQQAKSFSSFSDLSTTMELRPCNNKRSSGMAPAVSPSSRRADDDQLQPVAFKRTTPAANGGGELPATERLGGEPSSTEKRKPPRCPPPLRYLCTRLLRRKGKRRGHRRLHMLLLRRYHAVGFIIEEEAARGRDKDGSFAATPPPNTAATLPGKQRRFEDSPLVAESSTLMPTTGEEKPLLALLVAVGTGEGRTAAAGVHHSLLENRGEMETGAATYSLAAPRCRRL
nr:hypothetical protein Iba_chr05dCG11180 [Ipomoea batatas]